MVEQLIQGCSFDTARFFIFSQNVFGQLIYYSHFFALGVSLIMGIYVFMQDRKSLLARILFFITSAFSLWVLLDLILWASEMPNLIMFSWSTMIIVETLIYAACLYFIDVFIEKKDISLKKKVVIGSLLLPIIIFMPTKLTLLGFDLTNCNREPIEGLISTFYTYIVEILFSVWILFYAIKKYIRAEKENKKQIFLISVGIVLFLLAFACGNIIGSLTENWTLGQIGLFGMPVFIGFLAYLIVKFKTFNIKLMGAQVLVFVLGLLVFAILFIRTINNVRAVTVATLVLVIIAGYLLVRSVKKEVEQKEKLAKLNVELEGLLRQRESLVHLVTHKVKGSFTHTKYIFAAMLDGMYGPLSPELKKAADLGMEADNNGVATVDLILNAANLQKGTVKYDMKPTDFKELVEKTYEEKKEQAEKKGLKMNKEIAEGEYKINGDAFWLKEVVHNFIENSIRYTPNGEIVVGLRKENGKILYFIHDTGVGVTEEDKKNLFTEGGRGVDSVKVNVDSTGYGLYTVKLVVEAHGGRVWVQSEGQGKGSTFFAEFNAI